MIVGSFGCKVRDESLLYPAMSLEYNAGFLAAKADFKQIGIDIQPVKDWNILPEQDTQKMNASVNASTPVHILAAYQTPGVNNMMLVSQLPLEDTKQKAETSMQYLEKLAAQCDTTFTKGKFSHKDILFDQIVAKKGNLVYMHLIGKVKNQTSRFMISYIIPEIDYKDLIKKVEASISSINVTGR